jgi:hypothetical protein
VPAHYYNSHERVEVTVTSLEPEKETYQLSVMEDGV